MKKAITSTDRRLMLEEASKHQSVSLASEINWLRVWEAARDKGPFWTNIAQTFYKLLTRPLFGERFCNKCDASIQEDISFFSHLTQNHAPRSVDIPNLLADLRLQDSEPDTHLFSLHEITCLYKYHVCCISPYIGGKLHEPLNLLHA